MPNSPLHISVEGCIGIGKTTLATQLAGFRNAVAIHEDFKSNPFLEAFYHDPAGNAFETEMQFLLTHYHQLKGVASSNQETIADFAFSMNLVFGDMNFRVEAEKIAFKQLYDFLSTKLSTPHIRIYLKGSDDLVLERIRKRNRSMEQKSESDYYKAVNKAYERVFANPASNVIILEAAQFDSLNPKDIAGLSATIDSLKL